jgi:hypothetical protein
MQLTTDPAALPLPVGLADMLGRYISSWKDDQPFAQQAFQELINQLRDDENFYFVTWTRMQLAELLERSGRPAEASEQYTLALQLVLIHRFDGHSEQHQMATARALVWRVFTAQVNAGMLTEATRTAELAHTGYFTARIVPGNRSASAVVLIKDKRKRHVMRAACDAAEGRESWEIVRILMRQI